MLRLSALPNLCTAVTPPVRGSAAPSRRAHLRCHAKTARVERSRSREGRVARCEEAHPAREGEHPLPHREPRARRCGDEVVGAVFHAPGAAGGTDRGLAGERDQPLETTGGAASSPETSGQGSAIDASAQLALDEGGQSAAVGAGLASGCQEGLELLSHDTGGGFSRAPSGGSHGAVSKRLPHGAPRFQARREGRALWPASQETGLKDASDLPVQDRSWNAIREIPPCVASAPGQPEPAAQERNVVRGWPTPPSAAVRSPRRRRPGSRAVLGTSGGAGARGVAPRRGTPPARPRA